MFAQVNWALRKKRRSMTGARWRADRATNVASAAALIAKPASVGSGAPTPVGSLDEREREGAGRHDQHETAE